MTATQGRHAAVRPSPKLLAGLPWLTGSAQAYPVTARSEVATMLREGFAAEADGSRAKLIVYQADGGRYAAQLIIKPGKGRSATARYANTENASSMGTVVRAWWPELHREAVAN